MEHIDEISKKIAIISARNERVEADKAWETSLFRKALIAILTYLVITIFLYTADFPRPFVSAIVPTIGFVLSKLSIQMFKKIWLKYFYKK